MSKLAPCPFCGGKAQTVAVPGLHALVSCTKCLARTDSVHWADANVRGKVRVLWNTRALHPDSTRIDWLAHRAREFGNLIILPEGSKQDIRRAIDQDIQRLAE